MTQLIIHADDFGLTRGINYGIVDAHRRGVVTATSLIANGPAFEHALEMTRYADTLDIDLCVTRWGTTSFDVRYGGTVKGTPVFTCTITYVGVQLGTMEKAPLPAAVRAALGGG